MTKSVRGTFAISWDQVECDGAAGPLSALRVGATWAWRGEALRLDGPTDVLVLGGSVDAARLREHAARAVARVLGLRQGVAGAPFAPEAETAPARGFSVTDGLRRYDAKLVQRPGRPALCLFRDGLPPQDRELWISHADVRAIAPAAAVPEVICFTADARIATPDGPRLAGELVEGDLVLTRDDGPQPVRWIGRRRLSGARLYAMPQLRPIRIRESAMAEGRPDGDLLVSPGHRLLLRGALPRKLFGEAEVLVEARDLVNDHSIGVDRRLRKVTYVHLLLDRHTILTANGIQAESFHPSTMDLETMEPGQAAALEARVPGVMRCPDIYGGFARRMLTRSETAILKHAARRPH